MSTSILDRHSPKAIAEAVKPGNDSRPLPTVSVELLRMGDGFYRTHVHFYTPLDQWHDMGWKDGGWCGQRKDDDYQSALSTGTRYCPRETADGEPLEWVGGHLTDDCFDRLVVRYGPQPVEEPVPVPAPDPLAHLRELAAMLPKEGRNGMVVGRHIGLLMNIAEEVRRLRDETDLLKGREP